MTDNVETPEPWTLPEDVQLFGQEHADARVRKIWLAWLRAQTRIREQGDVLSKLKTTLERETNNNLIGFRQ